MAHAPPTDRRRAAATVPDRLGAAETPPFARVYTHTDRTGPVTVGGIVAETDVPQGTDYVSRRQKLTPDVPVVDLVVEAVIREERQHRLACGLVRRQENDSPCVPTVEESRRSGRE